MLIVGEEQRNGQQSLLGYALTYLTQGKSIFPVCTPTPGREHHCLQHGSHTEENARRKARGVSPLAKPGKHPLVPWAPYEFRLPTEAEVTRWWTEWPEANIGMATGSVSGIDVLDSDNGDARKDVMQNGVEPGPVVFTGRPGGQHWHFAASEEGFRNFAGRRPGLDLRGPGGYVLLPPSLHESGHHYSWAPHTETLAAAPFPDWLKQLCRERKPADDQESGDFLDLDVLLDGVPEGQRNDVLYRWAGKYVGEGLPIQYARAMAVMAARQCRPPFEEEIALDQVNRAYRLYVPNPVLDVSSTVGWTEQSYGMQHIADLMDQVDEDAPELVEGILWSDRITWCFGAPQTGKTLFLMALGLHVAAGLPFHGRTVTQGGVLLIEEDSPLSRAGEYLTLLTDIYQFDDPRRFPFYVNQTHGLRITSEAGYLAAIAYVERFPFSLKYLILDSCERLCPSDRYTSKELDWLVRFMHWCIEHGISPFLIDHTKKPGSQNGKVTTKTDPIDELIGGRAKSATADVMMYFTGAPHREAKLEYVKFRGESPPPFTMTFTGDFGYALKGERPALTVTQDRLLTSIRRLPEGWYSKAFLVEQAKVPLRTGERALAGLARGKWLLRRGEKKAGVEFSINPRMPDVFT